MLESFTGERQEMTRRERIDLFIVFSCSNRTQHWSTRTKLYLINFCQFGSNEGLELPLLELLHMNNLRKDPQTNWPVSIIMCWDSHT